MSATRQSGRKRAQVQMYSDDQAADADVTEKKKLKKEIRISESEAYTTTSVEKMPVPTRNKAGELVFPDHPEFRPNLTPEEVIRMGSFGGTYFRPIYSSITGIHYKDEAWKELPSEWFDGVNVKAMVTSTNYDKHVNKYKEQCGQGLLEWENSGWITCADPYGWFQWYCRFYLGRRCSDDERQLKRGLGVMGPKGRWKNNLINKIKLNIRDKDDTERALNDHSVSPKVRQLLQHWAYRVTVKDLTK